MSAPQRISRPDFQPGSVVLSSDPREQEIKHEHILTSPIATHFQLSTLPLADYKSIVVKDNVPAAQYRWDRQEAPLHRQLSLQTTFNRFLGIKNKVSNDDNSNFLPNILIKINNDPDLDVKEAMILKMYPLAEVNQQVTASTTTSRPAYYQIPRPLLFEEIDSKKGNPLSLEKDKTAVI